MTAGVHQAVLTSTAGNDDYQHLAFARAYEPIVTFEQEGRPYSILVRRDLRATAIDLATGWPCFLEDTGQAAGD